MFNPIFKCIPNGVVMLILYTHTVHYTHIAGRNINRPVYCTQTRLLVKLSSEFRQTASESQIRHALGYHG